ncbi:dienelactone hydrolase family protein [Mesorhizobium sp. CA8]|uniref:dienelactone hydrolase family protein n=1 Tax=unclassified Mesorhizobium TaxID=325217 RepID=UPI001CCCC87A|nr:MULTISPECIES: dienelactone hydrolase family protein [unclassified Mesorhizobium]MBZ9765054.1 dienelactone hydrolase family protein [Mesorhizobium sp. CA8]MBZ9823484.1 dienelactone hydrolase family protein [Mesorhizobium sp. CA4]
MINVSLLQCPFEIVLAAPDTTNPRPLVVVFPDIWGVRKSMVTIARTIAELGVTVVVPNFYEAFGYRIGTTDDLPDMVAKESENRLLGLGDKLSDEDVVSSTGAMLRCLKKDFAPRATSFVAVGFCMGARHVLRVAERYADDFRVMACLHGTDMLPQAPKARASMKKSIRGDLYFGFGSGDPYTPPEKIKRVRAAFDRDKVDLAIEIHPGANHGYAVPDRPHYDRKAAERDFAHIAKMISLA